MTTFDLNPAPPPPPPHLPFSTTPLSQKKKVGSDLFGPDGFRPSWADQSVSTDQSEGLSFAPWANSEKSPWPCEEVAGRRLATPLKLHGSCPCLDVSANLPPEDRGPQAGDVQQERWLKVQRRVCWCSSVWGSGFKVSGLSSQGFEVYGSGFQGFKSLGFCLKLYLT